MSALTSLPPVFVNSSSRLTRPRLENVPGLCEHYIKLSLNQSNYKKYIFGIRHVPMALGYHSPVV